MHWRLAMTAALCAALTSVFLAASVRSQEDAPRISKEEVRALLGDPAVAILDARITPDWKGNDRKIKGAVRVDPLDIGTWVGKYRKDQKIFVYCA